MLNDTRNKTCGDRPEFWLRAPFPRILGAKPQWRLRGKWQRSAGRAGRAVFCGSPGCAGVSVVGRSWHRTRLCPLGDMSPVRTPDERAVPIWARPQEGGPVQGGGQSERTRSECSPCPLRRGLRDPHSSEDSDSLCIFPPSGGQTAERLRVLHMSPECRSGWLGLAGPGSCVAPNSREVLDSHWKP